MEPKRKYDETKIYSGGRNKGNQRKGEFGEETNLKRVEKLRTFQSRVCSVKSPEALEHSWKISKSISSVLTIHKVGRGRTVTVPFFGDERRRGNGNKFREII